MKIYINHFTVLVDGSPQVMLFAIDLNGPARRARGIGKGFIDVEGITVSLMSSFQSPGVQRTKFVPLEAYGFSGYGDAEFSQEIFNIPMAQIESIV